MKGRIWLMTKLTIAVLNDSIGFSMSFHVLVKLQKCSKLRLNTREVFDQCFGAFSMVLNILTGVW